MKTIQKGLLLLISTFLFVSANAQDCPSFLKKQFTASNGQKLNYRIQYPLHMTEGVKYPILFFLHGAGERGDDNQAQLLHGGTLFTNYAQRKDFKAIIIAPQCPTDLKWSNYQTPLDHHERAYPYHQAPSQIGRALNELMQSYLHKDYTDLSRIYIAGLSMGAMGSYDFVLRYPKRFAACTAICGGANLKMLKEFKGKTAFRIFHGAQDQTVDPKFGRNAYQTLKESGKNVSYKEYPNDNHNSWDSAFNETDFLSWFLQFQL